MKRTVLLLFSVFFMVIQVFSKEGMWIPLLLEKYNLEEMQRLGFKLSAEDIYDINHASMKDAVVVFGGGCTAELISNEGLLLTNHHCGYRSIQSHSSVENDYLTDGFWAESREEELPNPGLSVRFLKSMKEVTGEVLKGTIALQGDEKEQLIRKNISAIEKNAATEAHLIPQVRSMFHGNQYFLFIYKEYRDVRLVGAPPSAIGKFGGDTDNWMWPRHTGDFSLFRIYANENNEPADYAPENIPFIPDTFFSVSLGGIEDGDFTMVLGNPGSTMQYIPSYQVDIIQNQRDPDRIAIRGTKLEIIGKEMESDPAIRIKYAAKYAGISNAWKKWQGEILGLERLNAVKKKQAFEQDFKAWAEEKGTWDSEYREVFDSFENLYPVYREFIQASDYYSEIVFRGVELFQVALKLDELINELENKQTDRAEARRETLTDFLPSFYKDYNQLTDEKLFGALLPVLFADLKAEFLPQHFLKMMDRHSGKLVRKVYKKSILTNERELGELLESGSEKQLLKLRNDPVVALANYLDFHFETVIEPVLHSLEGQLARNMNTYMGGILRMKEGEPLYPDANHTLRVSYGKVEGYQPRDGVRYKYFTTLEGIMDKDNPAIYDYNVPERLRELFETKDYGPYGEEDCLPVCFIASNHTTGGNSGSPVINDRGELIGLNFDRCWEGTMSDIMYDPAVCRNIAVDIRYVLFLIDKFAGAGYLLEEMDIRK